MNANEKTLLRVGEAAALLSISERSAYELIAAGRLRKVRLNARIRVPRAAVDEYVQQLEQEQELAEGKEALFRRKLRGVR